MKNLEYYQTKSHNEIKNIIHSYQVMLIHETQQSQVIKRIFNAAFH